MRILAVRGQGLTSLAEKFEVDFEAEPICSTGIFAIVGPTGAGKSTLLDAICLALFNKLPRMSGVERGEVAQAQGTSVGYNDVRSVLRHGAGSGFAEVDFVGQDGQRYRANWTVRRARDKADGNLQQQKICLTCLETDEVIGDRNTDTLAEIEKRVGLSFDQFRRAAMLSQGEFDAFIKAPSEERAVLLERITGTSIYSTISMLAYRRARDARDSIERLSERLTAHPIMEPETRLAVEAEKAAAAEGASRAETERGKLQAWQVWHHEFARLGSLLAEAEVAREQAAAADVAAEPQRADLKLIERGLALRTELSEAEAAAAAKADAASELGVAEAALAANRQNAADATVVANAASVAFVEVEREQATLLPMIHKAAMLDEQLVAERRLTHDAELQCQAAAERLAAAERAKSSVEADLAGHHATIEAERGWLAENRGADALELQLHDVMERLSKRAALLAGAAKMRDAGRAANEAAREAKAAHQAAEVTLSALGHQDAELGKKVDTLDARALAARVKALEATQRDTRALQAPLAGARQALTSATSASRLAADAGDEVSRHQAAGAAAQTMAERAKAELPAAAARLAEARRASSLSEASASDTAAVLRLLLRDGEPCAVCGATEHPLVVVDEQLKTRAAADAKRVTELETALADLHAQVTKGETESKSAATAVEAARGRLGSATAAVEGAAAAWTRAIKDITAKWPADHLGALPTAPATGDDSAGAWLDARTAAVDLAVAAADGELLAAQERQQELQGFRDAREALRTQLADAREQLKAAASAEASALRQADKLAAELSSVEQQRQLLDEQLATALDAVVPDWLVSEHPAAACRAVVDTLAGHRESLHASQEAAVASEKELAQLRQGLDASRADSQAAASRLGVQAKRVKELAGERAGLLHGQLVADVRTALEARLTSARQAHEAATHAANQAKQAVARAETRLEHAARSVEGASARLEGADKVLLEAAAKAGLTRETVARAVAFGAERVQVEASRLDALARMAREAALRCDERKKALDHHQSTASPDVDAAAISGAIVEADAALEAARELLTGLEVRIRKDDEAIEAAASIHAELKAEQERTRVWRELNELIGSADGARFRRFAQALTLEHLIALANRHLCELHPRYELQRVKASDLLLQVIDHDMGGEVRALPSLSGGEKFLVSLALALGLASMSSDRGIRVESLFIDEGFGSLDSNSLSMAVSVLERLQATGRRIGVISHVEELKERIPVRIEVEPVRQGESRVVVCVA